MNLLKTLYAIHSPSGGEKKMKKFVRKYVKQNIADVRISYDNVGNMYLVKGNADTYPCVVAHLDQVQKQHSDDFRCIETTDIIAGYSPSARSFQGLGADDKNGIWVALKCLEKYDTLKVALFVQEEVGCIGSSACNFNFFNDCRFVLQCDRKGNSDLVTNVFAKMASDEFVESTRGWEYGYKPTRGMLTDVAVLSEKVPISMVNISCGYFDPHTDNEFTCKADLLRCLAFVENIIENCTQVYYNHPTENDNPYGYYGNPYSFYDWDDKDYLI